MGSEQTYLHESEVLYDKIFPELYQFGGKLVYYLLMYLRQRIKLETNFEFCAEEKIGEKPTAVSGCQLSLGEETAENFFRKSSSDRRTILQIFLPFKTTTFCCFGEKPSPFWHPSYTSFLFRDNPLNSGAGQFMGLYTTSYLPHLLTFPRKGKTTKFLPIFST